MNRINFFLDIDGTIIPFGRPIPKSAKEAIEMANKMGHNLFLATGRSRAELDERLKALPFSGGVFSAGATIEYRGKVLFDRILSEEEEECIFSYINQSDLLIMIQTDEATYMKEEALSYFESSLIKYIGRVIEIPNLIAKKELPKNLKIKKFLALSPSGNIQGLRSYFKKNPQFTVVNNTVGLPQDIMAEVVLSGLTKATGIKEMYSQVGLGQEVSVSIGDGANDIEMIESADFGIAMGNADSDLKKKAKYVTSDINQDGLMKAIYYSINKYS